MLSISFFDLAHNALNTLGFLKGNVWVGYLFNAINQVLDTVMLILLYTL